MVHKVTASPPPLEEEPGDDALTPELIAEIDQLVPPQRFRALAGLLLVLAAFGFLIWPIVAEELDRYPQLVNASTRLPSEFDTERGLFSISGSVVSLSRYTDLTVEVVDLTIDAPGARLIELDTQGWRPSGVGRQKIPEPVTLPFELNSDGEIWESTTLGYTAWFEAEACETPADWGVVTLTLRDENGKESQVKARSYNSVAAIPAEFRALGVDFLQVACEVLR